MEKRLGDTGAGRAVQPSRGTAVPHLALALFRRDSPAPTYTNTSLYLACFRMYVAYAAPDVTQTYGVTLPSHPFPRSQKELTRLAVEEGCGEAPAAAPSHVPGCLYGWSEGEELAGLAEVRDEEVKGAGARQVGGNSLVTVLPQPRDPDPGATER